MAKVKGNKAVLNNTEEKIVTKYDKKVQKKQEQEKRDAKAKKITSIAATVILVIIVAVAGTATWMNYDKIHNEYIDVDGDKISKIEFDFYYSMTKQNILNQELFSGMTYGSYFASYMGYDTSKSDSSQTYGGNSDYTWYDYFANAALSTIKEDKALLKDADKNGFTYNADDDYNNFIDNLKSSADSAGSSVKDYYKTVFGENATEKNIKGYLCSYLKAASYQGELQTKLKPDDAEIASYYEEHKDDYDTVNYRIFDIKAETENDDNSLADAKAKADEMAAKATDESLFADLCIEYAGDNADTYKSESKASLKTLVKKSSVDGDEADWLFDSTRKTGDVTVVSDSSASKCSVVMFVSRSYDSSNDSTISNAIITEKYNELIASYADNMSVKNIKNRIKMYED